MAKIHRFFISVDSIDLGKSSNLSITDKNFVHQISRVLRYRVGDSLVLFNNKSKDAVCKINRISKDSVDLEKLSENESLVPKRDVQLFFSLMKKDKNDWVLQKCTELGVTNFVPIIAGRSEKTGFDVSRAKKIVTEAAEQCGRSDIPLIIEPISIRTALVEYSGIDLLWSEQTEDSDDSANAQNLKPRVGVFVGPEGGWTDEEKSEFLDSKATKYSTSKFTLRAETACVVAAAMLVK